MWRCPGFILGSFILDSYFLALPNTKLSMKDLFHDPRRSSTIKIFLRLAAIACFTLGQQDLWGRTVKGLQLRSRIVVQTKGFQGRND